MNNEQTRMVVAIVLSGLVLVGWQIFFAPEVVRPTKIATDVTDTRNVESSDKISTFGDKQSISEHTSSSDEIGVESNIHTYLFENSSSFYKISNKLTLLNAKNSDTEQDLSSTFDSQNFFDIFLIKDGAPIKLFFSEFQTIEKNKLTAFNETYKIHLNMQLNEDDKLHFQLQSNDAFVYRIYLHSSNKSDGRLSREYLLYRKDIERFAVGDEESGDGSFKWVGADFAYNVFAIVFPEKLPLRYKSTNTGTLMIEPVGPRQELSGYLFFARKNYDKLVAAGDQLNLAVDFGFFGIIAVPMLRGLQYLYKFYPNYGVAIILLTLFIRLILFPLNYKSFKSMKKMQLIQPQLQKIKEKFKDDPQRMQKETMAAFKREGANPLGGCLPILFQIPVFFAFYRVLFSAVELVGAPFFGWIQDLSIKDPYYVLPVLMTITMLLQQKIMPSPMTDPTQKKIMLIMPLVFGVIMKDLPSGLALYIFVSTLVGILQQFFVNKMA